MNALTFLVAFGLVASATCGFLTPRAAVPVVAHSYQYYVPPSAPVVKTVVPAAVPQYVVGDSAQYVVPGSAAVQYQLVPNTGVKYVAPQPLVSYVTGGVKPLSGISPIIYKN